MFPLPQKESRAPTACPGLASAQDLDSNHGDGLERECSRKPERKLPEFSGVGDAPATVPSDSAYLSSRGSVIKWFWDSAEEGYRTYHMDEYDEEKNPSGIINMGTSENKLCFDLLSSRLSQSDMLRVEPSLLQYPDWRGHLFLREEVARFLSFYCKSPAPLKPENVVVLNGCASVFSALATVLCEVGEAFLIPAPYYGAITQHIYLYGGIRLVCVYLDSEGVKVKGLILINPQNPLGDVYSPGELRDYLEFAKRHELHVMVDEVYMLSVFEESAGYHSVLSLEGLPDPQRTHVMWAASKDFGMSGLRFGTLYTENRDVATAVASLCRYHGLSGLVQHQMAQLLRDQVFRHELRPVSCGLRGRLDLFEEDLAPSLQIQTDVHAALPQETAVFVRLTVHPGEFNTQMFWGLLGREHELIIMPGNPQAAVGRSWEVNALGSHPSAGRGSLRDSSGLPSTPTGPFPTAVTGLNRTPLFRFPSFPVSRLLLATLAF
ncbi:1-aminocyclopropane-1-carboxylate synthase-like protein 1 isoform X6 [Suricata suricatta]|uniref:1-aminocyclopropane-1-carboxylate synthase-like protein 1 isoform X6 n=1 Tax=Suricata suricatta TaxID=37032 RepID=UPI001156B878|nr:1-aminocyclopropane-1-carboxylate synthase-like protein 1 isoform X6 [Suricata suricatta]